MMLWPIRTMDRVAMLLWGMIAMGIALPIPMVTACVMNLNWPVAKTQRPVTTMRMRQTPTTHVRMLRMV